MFFGEAEGLDNFADAGGEGEGDFGLGLMVSLPGEAVLAEEIFDGAGAAAEEVVEFRIVEDDGLLFHISRYERIGRMSSKKDKEGRFSGLLSGLIIFFIVVLLHA